MPEDAPQEKKEVEKIAKPRIPDPLLPPSVPPVAVHKVAEGIRCWVSLPVPVCIAYDDAIRMGKTGRVALEEELSGILEDIIHKPRKSKDVWSLRVDYPENPVLALGGTLEEAVKQIRSAIGEVK